MLHEVFVVFVEAADQVGNVLVGSGQESARQLDCLQVQDLALYDILVGVHPEVFHAVVHVLPPIFGLTQPDFSGEGEECSTGIHDQLDDIVVGEDEIRVSAGRLIHGLGTQAHNSPHVEGLHPVRAPSDPQNIASLLLLGVGQLQSFSDILLIVLQIALPSVQAVAELLLELRYGVEGIEGLADKFLRRADAA